MIDLRYQIVCREVTKEHEAGDLSRAPFDAGNATHPLDVMS